MVNDSNERVGSWVVRCAAENATAAPSKLVNPFEAEGTWFKANLHTHTTTSDGDVNVAVKVKQYRDKAIRYWR